MMLNALITGTMLGVEDHGILTAQIFLDYGGSGQAFGGYAFDQYIGERGHGERIATAYGMEFVRRTLKAVGVDSWEKLKGTHCRVKQTNEKVLAIGHIIKDQWFDPAELKVSG